MGVGQGLEGLAGEELALEKARSLPAGVFQTSAFEVVSLTRCGLKRPFTGQPPKTTGTESSEPADQAGDWLEEGCRKSRSLGPPRTLGEGVMEWGVGVFAHCPISASLLETIVQVCTQRFPSQANSPRVQFSCLEKKKAAAAAAAAQKQNHMTGLGCKP